MTNEPQANAWRVDTWYPQLGDDVLKKLKIYHDELIKFNKTVNLISPKTVAFADAIHFADSILATQCIIEKHPKIDRIFDLGSGNGFPGLVFATLVPQTKVVLVDSDERKCEFLKHMITTLGLKNAEVMNVKIESLEGQAVRYCMARGFASISKSILVMRKIVPKGGYFFHLKSENWSGEVGEIPTQLCSVWTPALLGDYRLPVGSVRFAVVQTEKIA